MQVPGSSNRVAAVWYSATNFTVDVNLGDGKVHPTLELYFDDWDNKARARAIRISDAGTGKVLDTETISSFSNGLYLDWKVSGNLLITITNQGPANAVLNGLFIDPTASTPWLFWPRRPNSCSRLCGLSLPSPPAASRRYRRGRDWLGASERSSQRDRKRGGGRQPDTTIAGKPHLKKES